MEGPASKANRALVSPHGTPPWPQPAPTCVKQASADSHQHALNGQQLLLREGHPRGGCAGGVDQQPDPALGAAVLQRGGHQAQAGARPHVGDHPVCDSRQLLAALAALPLVVIVHKAGLGPKVVHPQTAAVGGARVGSRGVGAQQRARQGQLPRRKLLCRQGGPAARGG